MVTSHSRCKCSCLLLLQQCAGGRPRALPLTCCVCGVMSHRARQGAFPDICGAAEGNRFLPECVVRSVVSGVFFFCLCTLHASFVFPSPSHTHLLLCDVSAAMRCFSLCMHCCHFYYTAHSMKEDRQVGRKARRWGRKSKRR